MTEPIPSVPSPAPEAPAEAVSSGLAPAGFWVRAGALMIDGFVMLVVRVAVIFGGAAGLVTGSKAFGLILSLAYATVTVGAWGQSLGHMAAGIKIVRNEDGGPLGYPMALARAAVSLVSTFLLCLGYLIVPFNARKRALHDFAAGSVAVYPEPVPVWRRVALAGLGVCSLALPLVAGFMLATMLGRGGGGLLTLINGGKYAELQRKSMEGATKGNLGSLRAAAAIYYGDHEGVYPEKPEQLFLPSAQSPKPLMDKPGQVQLADHPATDAFEIYGGEVCAPDGKNVAGDKLRDTGRWGIVLDKKSPCDGTIFVDCTHIDTKGARWYSY